MQMYTDSFPPKKSSFYTAHINKLIRSVSKHKQTIPISSRPQLQRYKRCFINHMAGVTTVVEKTRPKSISKLLIYNSEECPQLGIIDMEGINRAHSGMSSHVACISVNNTWQGSLETVGASLGDAHFLGLTRIGRGCSSLEVPQLRSQGQLHQANPSPSLHEIDQGKARLQPQARGMSVLSYSNLGHLHHTLSSASPKRLSDITEQTRPLVHRNAFVYQVSSVQTASSGSCISGGPFQVRAVALPAPWQSHLYSRARAVVLVAHIVGGSGLLRIQREVGVRRQS